MMCKVADIALRRRPINRLPGQDSASSSRYEIDWCGVATRALVSVPLAHDGTPERVTPAMTAAAPVLMGKNSGQAATKEGASASSETAVDLSAVQPAVHRWQQVVDFMGFGKRQALVIYA